MHVTMGGCYITVCTGLCAAVYDHTSIVVLLVEKGGVEIVKCFVWFFLNQIYTSFCPNVTSVH